MTVATLKDYQSQLEVLSKQRIAGTHKMNQLLKYLEKGFSVLLHKNSVAILLDLGTIDDIVCRVETHPSKS